MTDLLLPNHGRLLRPPRAPTMHMGVSKREEGETYVIQWGECNACVGSECDGMEWGGI